MAFYYLIEVVLAAIVPLSLWLIIKQRGDKGFDNTSIRLLTLTTVVPLIAILTLEEVMSDGAAAGIIGVIAGYIFASTAGKSEK